MESGATLYVVATPIGNLEDISARAIRVLGEVDLIAAEDTRHSARLLDHLGVSTPMLAYHDHNERERSGRLLDRIAAGESVALISDAGTPLISDPGYHLVSEARQRGIRVVPVPGASAMIAALSVAGLPSDRFQFEGFLPAKRGARRQRIEQLASAEATWIFYESTHRILDCMEDLVELLGDDRELVVAREISKTFETIQGGPVAEVLEWMRGDSNQQRGEFVVLVRGAPAQSGQDEVDPETRRMLEILLEELPLKQASALASRISGVRKKALYQLALQLKGG
ncbi:16S rRNA (cytidine(1402)-2'-O)-methyltransferase [Aestuariirhabdus litorea]|uniref:Ribosomal RNA small subunit methyltransferase I n=1 Tax=Aestuariirhabdus litorea TaxID=2528527 RepID=A0A3P3VRD7_9GAMM|nr:16S rRNA (cytidine(1402)-2'-O)-methyltransferase [Aestuariirhabdus litorea]RRJ85352.1 16S rRNA (cytidine(1402)-2'-O)-methyltransferase [Aestuariirhabdus litorea]RWW98576.1 16S rRNA (cytidine(1402)-2'-O)-methyltransferase [Endozoicomonadaceae bacterium GTF-13]